MAVLTGKQFTVKSGTTDYSAVVTTGSTTASASSETIQTLAGSEVISQGVEDTTSCEFLYDEASGFYKLLWDAIHAGTTVAVEIVGGTGKWTGTLLVTDLGNEFPADGAATCTAEFSGELTFAAVTP